MTSEHRKFYRVPKKVKCKLLKPTSSPVNPINQPTNPSIHQSNQSNQLKIYQFNQFNQKSTAAYQSVHEKPKIFEVLSLSFNLTVLIPKKYIRKINCSQKSLFFYASGHLKKNKPNIILLQYQLVKSAYSMESINQPVFSFQLLLQEIVRVSKKNFYPISQILNILK